MSMKASFLLGIASVTLAQIVSPYLCGDSDYEPLLALDSESGWQLVDSDECPAYYSSVALTNKPGFESDVVVFGCCSDGPEPKCDSTLVCDKCLEAGCAYNYLADACEQSCPDVTSNSNCAVTLGQCPQSSTPGNCYRRCNTKGWQELEQTPGYGRRLLTEGEVEQPEEEDKWWYPQPFYGNYNPFPTYYPPMPAPPPPPPPTCMAVRQLECRCSCDSTCAAKGVCCYDYVDRCV